MPHSSVLAINKKRRAARAEVYELKGRDGNSGSTKQEDITPHDDEERLWPNDESRNELVLHQQSTAISNKGFRDGSSTSTLDDKPEKS